MSKLRKIISSLAALTILGSTLTVGAGADGFTAKGDLNNSGTIETSDIVLLAAHVKGLKPLDGSNEDILVPDTERWAADVNRDGAINATDISIIAAHVKGIRNISSSTNAYKTVNPLALPDEDDIIARALRLSEVNLRYYSPGGSENRDYDFSKGNESVETAILNIGIDCSGIVNYSLASLGIGTEGLQGSVNDNATRFGHVPAYTGDWLNKCNELEPVVDAYWVSGGETVPMEVLKNGVSTAEQRYYQYGDDNAVIPVGSIVVGFAVDQYGNRLYYADHMWIYLGEYSSAGEVRERIASLTEKTPEYVRTKIGSQGFGYKADNSDNDRTHWRLESTGTWHGFDNYTGPQINNDFCPETKTQYLIYVFAPPKF